MFQNYLKIIIRNLIAQKIYSLINIAGLAIGMSSCLIILSLVRDELSFDRFHQHAEQIYRLTLDAKVESKEFITARTSTPLAEALRKDFPEVEAATHFRGAAGGGGTRNWAVRYGENAFDEWLVFFTDTSFFDVFTCEILEGNMNDFLTQPNTIVLTDQIARKYFGEKPALGKMLIFDNRLQYMVCGVVKAFPLQSHWRFDFLASSITVPFRDNENWINHNTYTYARLREGASSSQVEAKLNSMIVQHVRPLIQEVLGADWKVMESRGMYYRYHFQPLTDIHLRSNLDEEIFPHGNINTVYAFILISIFILLIACINFMNLSTARSARRAKEVGVRKVLGSKSSQMVNLFLSEAIFLSALAMLVSVGLIELALPAVNQLTGKALSLSIFASPLAIFGLLGFTLFVGVLAGSYPAFVLSSFQPVTVLKGKFRTGMRSGRFRSALVVFQFAISIALMVGTMVVSEQLHFVRSRDLGFDKEQMLVVDNTWLLGNQTKSFKELLLNKPGILAAAFTQNLPGNDIGSAAYRPEGSDRSNILMLRQLWCDLDFLSTMKVKLREGRFLNPEFSTDSTSAVVINQHAAELLGYDQPVGRTVIGFFGSGEKAMTIVGVTENFHYEPLHQPILPMVILFSHGAPTRIVLRVQGEIPKIIDDIHQIWNTMSGGQPFKSYFLDDHLEKYYRNDRTLGKLFGTFATLAIFISCLGLLGLVMYATEQRTKEIGIRKALGASTTGILGLLSKEFVKLVMLANLIAWPVAWYFMHGWLQNFAYRIQIGWWVFVWSGGLVLLIALLTVSWQSIRAATANPIESLRYE